MSEIRGRLADEINTSLDERSNLEPGSEERARHDKALVDLYEVYERDLKLDYDDYSEERRVDFEKEKYMAELEQKDRQVAEESKHSKWKNILKGAAIVVGTIMTGVKIIEEKDGLILDDAFRIGDKFEKFRKED